MLQYQQLVICLQGVTIFASKTASVGLNASSVTYVPVNAAVVTISGGGLTVPNSTVTLEKGADTNGTGNITSTDKGTTEPTSGYY